VTALLRRRGILSAGGLDRAYLPMGLLNDGVNAVNSERTPITISGSASANVEGVKAVLHAGLSADCDGIYLTVYTSFAGASIDNRGLLAIYTGGAGSEVLWGRVNVSHTISGATIYIPGRFVAGTRITATLQTAQGSRQLIVVPNFITADTQYFSTAPAESLGFVTASSQGTTLTTPAGANTKSAWTQITTATVNKWSAVIVGFGFGVISLPSANFLVDVGIGAAGSETVLVSNIHALPVALTDDVPFSTPLTYQVNVPAGSRLSMRFQADVASYYGAQGSLTGIVAA
jgi:hypothetical protein